MTKSILVIDTPPCCEDCPCSTIVKAPQKTWEAYCELCEKFNNRIMTKPEWCPLKGMPHELEHDGDFFRTADIYHDGYVDGWNYLLSLLEEDEEEEEEEEDE